MALLCFLLGLLVGALTPILLAIWYINYRPQWRIETASFMVTWEYFPAAPFDPPKPGESGGPPV